MRYEQRTLKSYTLPKDKIAVLSLREPHDAAVNFDTYQILQRHRAVSLPQHGFLVYICNRSNDDITHNTLIFTAVMAENHGTRLKSR